MENKVTNTSLNTSKWCFTNCNTISTEFHWNISNFSLMSLEQKVESAVFSMPTKDEEMWKLILYPNHNAENGRVSIFLHLVDCKETNIKVYCDISIINNNNREHENSFINIYEHKDVSKCVDIFLSCADLAHFQYLKNDTLRIKCKIKRSTNEINSYIQEAPDLGLDTEVLYKDLSKDISSLYQDQQLSDVCLEVEDVKFPVHKIILAARSSVFSAMFRNNMKESRQNVIKIQNIRPDIMKAMITFIYTSRADDIEGKALELLKSAEMYDLKGLKLLCENAISKSFTVDNIVEMLQIAEVYDAKNLKRMAVSFIKDKM